MAAEGDVIGGRYRLLAQIGEGGMSRVYLALDTVLNKQWAAKEIKPVDDPASASSSWRASSPRRT